MWIPRLIEKRIHQAVKTRPVVMLTGARQVGKSSLLQNLYPKHTYVTLDHIRQAELANDNPEYFLSSLSTPAILDEMQYAPELFRYLKVLVDENRSKNGQWILTGSQKFELMQSVSESLAGRIAIIELDTLSAEELRGAKARNLNSFLWKGGYPELWENQKLSVRDFFESYIRTYLERDLKAIINVSSLQDFQRFLRVTATRAGSLVNYRNIAKDVGVSSVTIKSWISALEQSGVVYILPPFFANLGKRMIKSSKLYFADHGLLCFLLNINSLDDWQGHIMKGNVWENFVFSEILKNNRYRPGYQLFFYRDQNGVEMDFLIEDKKTITLIEAKSTENPDKKKFNFNKIEPLFKKYSVECLVALNISDKKPLKMKNYT
ncbi:MAG TPA: ATP-binding protein, partial [Gammaproteobacteria bacterium]|nr:ATP-binding protein [Gammaproteobacteria bacterium]